MKTIKLFTFLAALLCATTAWAQTNVSNDTELRNAIQDGANIVVTADIELSNSTLVIAESTTVTIDLGGHTLDRKLTQRGEGGGQVVTVRSGATLNLSNGTLTGGWGGDGGEARLDASNVNRERGGSSLVGSPLKQTPPYTTEHKVYCRSFRS